MLNGSNNLRRFGEFALDCEKKELWFSERPVQLPLKTVELLCLLVCNPGELVTKEQIFSELWNGSFVEESNITHHIYALRKTFKEFGQPDPIMTVPRRGYRFSAELLSANGSVAAVETTAEPAAEPVKETLRHYPRISRTQLLAAAFACAVIVALTAFAIWQFQGLSRIAALEQSALKYNSTQNADAYQLYLRGRDEWNKRSIDGMANAQRLFRDAIEKDPNFALAYTGLADVLAMEANSPEVDALIEKALQLDPDLAEAHASKGFVSMYHYWRWQDAEDELKKAIALNPNYLTSYHWYGQLLAVTGRTSEAQATMQRALQIDPLSYNTLAYFGQIYYFSRQYPQAEEFCIKAIEINPDLVNAHVYLHNIYMKTGAYGKAVDEIVEARKVYRPDSLMSAEQISARDASLDNQRSLYQEAGIAKWLELDMQASFSDSFDLNNFLFRAQRYALLGDREKALDNIERAYEMRAFFDLFISADPIFDDLRDEPRYQQVLQKMNL